MADIELHLPTLIGDATITAASVVYLGPFSSPQRATLQQAWVAALAAAGVPVQPTYNFEKFMSIRAPQVWLIHSESYCRESVRLQSIASMTPATRNDFGIGT